MRKLIVLLAVTGTFFIYSCGGDEQKPGESKDQLAIMQGQSASKVNPAYDADRGKGKFTNVEIANTLDPAMVTAGEKVYNIKCSGCHKLTNEKLVGPGWKDVTTRHKAEWIMNFVTNTDEMIDKDPKAQAMLELCMVRMPNQNISDEAARGVYEYMRKNDGVK